MEDTRFVGLDQVANSVVFGVYTTEGKRLFPYTVNSLLGDLTDEAFLALAGQLREVRSRLASGELRKGQEIKIEPDGKIQVSEGQGAH